MKTATRSAPSNTRRPSLKDTNRHRAQALAARLTTPPAEILEMILAAGIEAIEKTLQDSGRLVLPLEFAAVADLSPIHQERAEGINKPIIPAHAVRPTAQPLYGLKSDAEIFFVDMASRKTPAPSFAAFVREVLLSYAESIAGTPPHPFPDRMELPKPPDSTNLKN